MTDTDRRFTAIDLCSGVGGHTLGFEAAGFDVAAAVDIDPDSCTTIRTNRPDWHVLEGDLGEIDPVEHSAFDSADLLACGMPRAPYSVAGRQQATDDRRDVLRAAIDMATYVRPRALLLENIPAFMRSPRFEPQRRTLHEELTHLGYESTRTVLHAFDFCVPQRRSHGFLLAMRPDDLPHFEWPTPSDRRPQSLGDTLRDSMASGGWPHADEWADQADGIAPLVVGGATGRGGADLGPSRTKKLWAHAGIYGGSIGDTVPGPGFAWLPDVEPRFGLPRITVDQVALLQGFDPDWRIHGKKTSAYRQISQATPPPLATVVAQQIIAAFGRQPRAGLF